MSDVQAFIIKNGYISNSVTHDRYKLLPKNVSKQTSKQSEISHPYIN